MTDELYKKYRPTKFGEVIGQDDAVKMLTDFGKRGALPHFLLLTGPSGCGKTTIARILRRKLNCSDSDFHQQDCGQFRGIDMVREIKRRMSLSPIGGGKCRVWLIDECHKLTSDAQAAFLNLLEDTPGHVYFMMATTDPRKLLPTVRTRATEVKIKPLKTADMEKLLESVTAREGLDLSDDVCDKIIGHADGSPRKALVLLGQAMTADDDEGRMAAVERGDSSAEAIEVARALLDSGTTWKAMAKVLNAIDLEEDAEGIRYLILAYCTKVVLGGGPKAARAFLIIDVFRDSFYYSRRAGLVAACWEVIKGPAVQ